MTATSNTEQAITRTADPALVVIVPALASERMIEGVGITPARWAAERHFRPAQRGPNDRVADGWIVRDRLLLTSRWADTLPTARSLAAFQESHQAEARHRAAQATAWWATSGTHAGAEVWLDLGPAADLRRVQAGLVGTGRDGRPRPEAVAALLELIGLPELEERS